MCNSENTKHALEGVEIGLCGVNEPQSTEATRITSLDFAEYCHAMLVSLARMSNSAGESKLASRLRAAATEAARIGSAPPK